MYMTIIATQCMYGVADLNIVLVIQFIIKHAILSKTVDSLSSPDCFFYDLGKTIGMKLLW